MTATLSAPPAAAECCIVIVHYRCEDDLRECVRSVVEHAGPLPIVIVENGSGPGMHARLEAAFADLPHVACVDAGRNDGFGAGCNHGIAVALARFPGLRHVLLLNPDTVVTAGCVEALQATARRRGAGIVGGRVVDLESGATWFENGRVRPWTLTRCHVAAPPGAREFETTFVTGAMMLVDADLLRAGLRFDEAFFLYVEDMDFCASARDRGRTLWVTTDAVVRHRGGGSQPHGRPVLGELRSGQLQQMTRSKVLYAKKRLSWPQRTFYLLTATLVRPLLGLWLTRGRTAFLRPYFRGLWQGLSTRRAR